MTRHAHSRLLAAISLLLVLAAPFQAPAAVSRQPAFETPEAAAEALFNAVRSGDLGQARALLGPGSQEALESASAGEGMAGRAHFVAAYEQSARVVRTGARAAVLMLGTPEWRFAYPLVRNGAHWQFDDRAGKRVLIARRIERNETFAIKASLAYVEAQRDYALEAHDGAGPGLYARVISSTPGRHDGLFWTPTREYPLSPLAPNYTFAAADATARRDATALRGYLFRVLESQGARAPDGATAYLEQDRLVRGFALVAYPAGYRDTGVRTFIVSHHGTVFARDLGGGSTKLGSSMKRFDPGSGWKPVATASERPRQLEAVARIVADHGCTVCHREALSARATDDAPPLAPTWREIATRYRGDAAAQSRLARVVLEGADPGPPHWKGRLEFNTMGANAPRVTPEQARDVARWILSTR